jgi:threonine synthase
MSVVRVACEGCGAAVDPGRPARTCPTCGGRLGFEYRAPAAGWPPAPGGPPPSGGAPERAGMWAYRALLPLGEDAKVVSLGEGETPLLPARADRGGRLYWKNEAQNPTGSQKDRALALAVSRAVELRAPRVVIASTGSAGLACAAYSARAGLPCLVLVPDGTPPERLGPMAAFGARIGVVKGTFVQIERLLDALAGHPGWYEATTKRAANPYQAEAPKTIAYEVVAQLGRVPDWVVVPVGGGGTLHGIWRGFRDLQRLGGADRLPRLVGVQPASFNTLEVALARGLRTEAELETIAMDERVETIARNLKHGVPPDGADALAAIRASGGLAVSVTDAEALGWQRRLATEEGLFCEPSSATAAAAAAALGHRGAIGPTDTVVCVITGSGFREVGTLAPAAGTPVDPDGGAEALDRILPLADQRGGAP